MAQEKKTTKARAEGSDGKSGKKAAADKSTPPPVSKMGDRVEAYARLATQFRTEAAVMLPKTLTGQGRREHVRACILEDHADRIDTHAEGTTAKFDKLAKSLFSFFRGTALLFYRDMAGSDARMPTVLLLGDVHPENFGVMPNRDNVPIFSVNDFDEVSYGPFSWDIKRGAVGFMIAAKEEGGFKKKKRRKIAKHFVSGYIAGMTRYAQQSDEIDDVYRLDNSPKIISSLIKSAMKDRSKWLDKRYANETREGFRVSDELTPISSRRDEFQKLIEELVAKKGIETGGRFGDLRVKDVAIRHGQGTASLGLSRYYVLIEGALGDGTDDAIIEFKRARRSALYGLVPDNGFGTEGRGERIAHGQAVHLTDGDQFYGNVDIDGMSFMTRERAPFRDDIDLDDLSYDEFKNYAEACGRALAQAHARSDEAGRIDYDIEPSILDAMTPRGLFIDDMVRFAEETSDRLERDHESFRRDHKLGAFETVQQDYR
ncbi:DUF2252 domain-containing protein [Pararhizobium mangrovi]|uniref:DUF2252 domain-containing protein n=1 Tax=Pararhizobium mangrovi TaxID=2590452 RepID=A0A506U647_9HYPH|nr:DUF2252 family protein [Pararhizobium mangrovi]TPW27397.1 DUF2252 domain-containing protein [Pararhizobium mangrovi]